MNAAERKMTMIAKMKSDATLKLAELETLKVKTLQDIDNICGNFLNVCLEENNKLQTLVDFESVREYSQDLEKKLTRMNNFLSELPIYCQEFYERDIFDSDASKVATVQPQRIELPSLAELDIGDSLDFLNTLAPSESPPSSERLDCFEQGQAPPTEKSTLVCSRRKKKKTLSSPIDREQDGSVGSSGVISQFTSASEHHRQSVKPPPVPRVACPQECQVAVTHVDGPDRFYVQIFDLRSRLEDLEASILKGMMEEDKALLRLDRNMIGGPAIVYCHEYRNFFRAWTRRQLASDETVEVYFLDWGNTSFVSLDSCYIMPPKFSNLPAAAIQCCLQRRTSANSPSSQVSRVEYQWPVSAKSAFKKMVLNKKVTMSFIGHYEVAEERPRDMYQSLSYVVNISMGSGSDVFEKLVKKDYRPLNL